MSEREDSHSVDHGDQTRSRSHSPKLDMPKDSDLRKIGARRKAVGYQDVRTVRDLKKKNKGDASPPKTSKKKKGVFSKMENDVESLLIEGEVDTLQPSNIGVVRDAQQENLTNKDENASQIDIIIVNDNEVQNGNNDKDWNNPSDDETVIAKKSANETCDNNMDIDKRIRGERIARGDGGVLPAPVRYIDSDKGPFIVHLTEIMKTDKEVVQDIHDTIIGLKLKKLKVKGIREVKKISRRELKMIFDDKLTANDFLNGGIPQELGVDAYIPKYNITKVGIVFDIPTGFSDEQLMMELESELPIVGVFRCQKRRIENGTKTKEWMAANTIKITFRGQSVPDEVVFGYSKRKVKPDVPGVIQCFKCLRFGHISKYCRQETTTCQQCGSQHSERPCSRDMKCFHCHDDKHDGRSKDCFEFLRNQLMKESMYYSNLTFTEANELFPRTESCYRLAEKQREFPGLPQRRKVVREERVEESFPRKTAQDLKKQYSEYIQLNRGVKPSTIGPSDTRSYSEVTRIPGREPPIEESRFETKRSGVHKQQPSKRTPTEKFKTHKKEDALKFIKDLSHKLSISYTDPDQAAGSSLSNDLVLIDVGRMIMEFLLTAERETVFYSGGEEGFSESEQ